VMAKQLHETRQSAETERRSVVKAITYRIVILILDFICVYLFTGKIRVAVGFMIVSNIYTTVSYFIHERIWDKIKWGRKFNTIQR
jgi:uncharacterized membrane protein